MKGAQTRGKTINKGLESMQEKSGGDLALKRAPGVDLPRVDVGDVEGAKAQLAEYGVCVFRSVLNAEELAEGTALFWRHVERNALDLGIKRNNRNSHLDSKWKHLGFKKSGVMTRYSVGQSEFIWYVRTRPAVTAAFQTVWGTEDLVTSFDGCGAARNPYFQGNGGKPMQRSEKTRKGKKA